MDFSTFFILLVYVQFNLGGLIICLLLYYKSVVLRKRYFLKAKEYKGEIEILKAKIEVLEKKIDLDSIDKFEINELSSQVLELHKLLIKNIHLK